MKRRSMRRLAAGNRRGLRRQDGPKRAGLREMENKAKDRHAEEEIAEQQDFHGGAFLQLLYFFGGLAGEEATGDPVVVLFVDPRGPGFWPGDDEGERPEADCSPGEPQDENELRSDHTARRRQFGP